MEQVVGIGGVFFKARDPRRSPLVSRTLGVPVEPEQPTGLSRLPRLESSVCLRSLRTPYFGSARHVHVNYRVRNLDAMLAQLRAAGYGGRPSRGLRLWPFGWATDRRATVSSSGSRANRTVVSARAEPTAETNPVASRFRNQRRFEFAKQSRRQDTARLFIAGVRVGKLPVAAG